MKMNFAPGAITAWLSLLFVQSAPPRLACGCAVDVGEPSIERETVGSVESPVCKNALSQPQEQIALKLIDDICGDTWCSGDYNYAFRHLTCSAPRGLQPGTCTLSLEIIPREGVPSPRPLFNRTCTTGDSSSFDSLVATASSGYQYLQPDYYAALTECISNLEAALPH
jgi:hypothetical protein